jgi:hypothetical protein
MHPWPLSAEIDLRPRDADTLRDRATPQGQKDRISGNDEPCDTGPLKSCAEFYPAAIEGAIPPQISDIKTVSRQRLNCNSFAVGAAHHIGSLVARHGLNVLSRKP